jgi:hypothetical protein
VRRVNVQSELGSDACIVNSGHCQLATSVADVDNLLHPSSSPRPTSDRDNLEESDIRGHSDRPGMQNITSPGQHRSPPLQACSCPHRVFGHAGLPLQTPAWILPACIIEQPRTMWSFSGAGFPVHPLGRAHRPWREIVAGIDEFKPPWAPRRVWRNRNNKSLIYSVNRI